jgi:hypothetical protein
VLGLQRGEHFLALSNFSEHAVRVDLLRLHGAADAAWFDCLAEIPVENVVVLEPWGTAWLERLDRLERKT